MRYAEDLATDYGFETREEYFDYIITSYENGQKEQAGNLFMKMKDSSKLDFLNTHLKDDNGIQTSTRKFCIFKLIN